VTGVCNIADCYHYKAHISSVFSSYMLAHFSTAEPMGKSEEGVTVDNHTDVPQ